MGTSLTHTFIVGPQKAYRQGKLYEPGEKIVLPKTELPSKTWLNENGSPVKFKTKVIKGENGKPTKVLDTLEDGTPILEPPGQPTAPPEPDLDAGEVELVRQLEELRAQKAARAAPSGEPATLADAQAATGTAPAGASTMAEAQGKKPPRPSDKSPI